MLSFWLIGDKIYDFIFGYWIFMMGLFDESQST